MERMPAGPFDPHRLAHGGPGDTEDASRRAQRQQILATEHWSLLATRSLSASIGFVKAIVAAVLSVVVVVQLSNLSMDSPVPVASGAVVFAVAIALQAAFNIRSFARYARQHHARFPPLEPASGQGAPPRHD
jgi:hypothetical protein